MVAVTFASAWALVPAAAIELRDPVAPSSTGVVPNPPNPGGVGACTPLPAEGPVTAASLIVRNSNRPDVGPYTVQLPGYATDPVDPSKDRYAPFVIETKAGNTLRIDLSNALSASYSENVINLHAHGLIVSPRPTQPCAPPGDYIFLSLPTGQTAKYRLDIPATVKGVYGTSQLPYPTGLYWIHSHVHGSARDQITAGQTALLSVGPGTGGSNANPASGPNTNIRSRYLALRDIQLSVPHGKTPDLPGSAGQLATWLSADSYDTQACRAASNTGIQMLGGAAYGYCGHAGIYDANGKITDNAHDTVWLFTVNGQYLPDITVAPGGTEIWRIANLSATVTYVLTLVDGSGAEQTMQLLTLDGVVASNSSSGSSTMSGLTLKRVLLMPASRAEILVPNTANKGSDVSLTLRTEGIETGLQPAGVQKTPVQRADYNGDPWPAVSLAHVVMKGSKTIALASVTSVASRPQQSLPPGSVAGHVPENCITLPGTGFRRLITFAQTATDFRIGSDVVDVNGKSADGTAANPAHRIDPVVFDHASPPESTRHPCAPLGSTEVWEIHNTTTELHNFHIHQTKFRLTQPGDPGAPPGLTPSTAVQDPARVVIDQIPEFANSQPASGADIWHDTMPVPPADAKGNPGVIFVTIQFTDPVQVGTFVFHCHILEHEDSGMMSAFQLYDPKAPSAISFSKHAGLTTGIPFCGRPPPSSRGFITDLEEARPIAQGLSGRVTEAAAIVRDWLFLPYETLRIH
jgi:FtsP/CotA-like multicopper oxidase with cupredoxin domain